VYNRDAFFVFHIFRGEGEGFSIREEEEEEEVLLERDLHG